MCLNYVPTFSSSKVSCEVYVNTNQTIVHQDCYPEVSFYLYKIAVSVAHIRKLFCHIKTSFWFRDWKFGCSLISKIWVFTKYKQLLNLAETQTKTNITHTNHPSKFWAINALRINRNQAFIFFTWVPRPSIIYHMWLFLTTS